MAANLRETAAVLAELANTTERDLKLSVHLDEVPGEETALSTYAGAEEDENYVDVFLAEDGAEFWYEGSKRQVRKVETNEELASAILEWLKSE
jgi:hypothetical protein